MILNRQFKVSNPRPGIFGPDIDVQGVGAFRTTDTKCAAPGILDDIRCQLGNNRRDQRAVYFGHAGEDTMPRNALHQHAHIGLAANAKE